MKDVVIVSAVRTPIGSFGGGLLPLTATQIGAAAISGALQKANVAPEIVDEVIMGCVIQANLGQNPARQASKYAGLPDEVISNTVNKVCASGMKSVSMAAQAIALGDAEVVVAGGMECMSNVPFYAPNNRWGNKYGDTTMVDGLAKDGLMDVYHNYPMGNAAELCAEKYNITREQQDEFAIGSYKRSQKAWEDGSFDSEVVPINVPQRRGDDLVITKDEEPFNVNFEKIPSLRPAFQKDGTVTAANASTINDGAAALVLMSAEKASELGIQAIAKIKSYADAEQAPEWFTTSPAVALPKAAEKAGLQMKDIEYFELNEAFSVVGIANEQLMDLDHEKVNVFGGAVSLGHPLGCSGARILVTLINVLQKKGAKYGGAGICNGGGGASAMILERI